MNASHAPMAEYVMLDKGSHMIKVMETLKDILTRSGGHRDKKTYTFRSMQIAKDFLECSFVSYLAALKETKPE